MKILYCTHLKRDGFYRQSLLTNLLSRTPRGSKSARRNHRHLRYSQLLGCNLLAISTSCTCIRPWAILGLVQSTNICSGVCADLNHLKLKQAARYFVTFGTNSIYIMDSAIWQLCILILLVVNLLMNKAYLSYQRSCITV